jgi:hypothetical protein
MATAQQIRETAAENLGILGEGEVLPSYESDDLDQAYIEVYSELEGLELTAWAQASAVPDQYARSIAMLVAEARAVKYQIPDNRYQRIKIESIEAMSMIRKQQAINKMGQTEIENF